MTKLTLLLLLSLSSWGLSVKESLQKVMASPDFVEISAGPLVALDLRYGTTNNFVGKDLYGEFKKAFLHKFAAAKLKQAEAQLQRLKPGYKILIFDVLRPRSVQRILWSKVVNTPQQGFVGNPDKGSMHNFGMAIDLSLMDASGKELDMGTPFDDFTDLAQPKMEEKNLAAGLLTNAQLENRKLLRKIMTDAGFIQLPHEWWHYDALPGDEVRAHYAIVE
jgi:D-alanyl-D-alanine dipeptidase